MLKKGKEKKTKVNRNERKTENMPVQNDKGETIFRKTELLIKRHMIQNEVT